MTDDLRQIIREELAAAGIGEQAAPSPIYDLEAELWVLGALLDNQTTLHELAPLQPGHCLVPWVSAAMSATGTIDDRIAQMVADGYPPIAVTQVRELHELSPILPRQIIAQAAVRITEHWRCRTLAHACTRVACELQRGGSSVYSDAVQLLRETIIGLR
jgi:hypothetical protein